jgi:hypothetical protein
MCDVCALVITRMQCGVPCEVDGCEALFHCHCFSAPGQHFCRAHLLLAPPAALPARAALPHAALPLVPPVAAPAAAHAAAQTVS